jgi:hypothetical protein
MSGIIKRSASQAVEVSPSRRSQPNSPLPKFVPPQLSKPVAAPPSGPQWLHEIKLDGFRMAARIDNGRVQLLTRTGLDWTAKYPTKPDCRALPRPKRRPKNGSRCKPPSVGFPNTLCCERSSPHVGDLFPRLWKRSLALANGLRAGHLYRTRDGLSRRQSPITYSQRGPRRCGSRCGTVSGRGLAR